MLKKNVVLMCFSAFFVVFLCVCGMVSFPLIGGVSFTLQTFGVALCGYVLGVGWSNICILAYISLGFVGFPVFSGLGAGIGVIAGPTGGFLVGFIPLGLACAVSKKIKPLMLQLLISFLGLAVCHIMGVLWLWIQSGGTFYSAFAVGSFPFIIKDLILVFAAFFISNSNIFKKLKI